MTKIKRVQISEGEGRQALLEKLDKQLKNERITAGRYLVVIAKISEGTQVRVRPRVTRKRKKASSKKRT